MGKYWSIDAVKKDVSTSLYGTAVSIDESPVKENLLYVGTDDGVISITENAKTWREVKSFPGVPDYCYVSDILASKFDENVVYVSFDNRKRNDFKPYILKSEDKGKSWESISNNLPENGTVHSIQQDFINPRLLFVGTEFGLFFSPNGGEKWIQLKGGLPTIAVRDIAIQKRESDLAIATFGRGFYLLDDYSPLRKISKSFFEQNKAFIFPVRDALMYVENGNRYGQGADYFRDANPPFGATFTYYLKDAPKTKFEMRKEKEKELFKKSEKIPQPPYSEIRKENEEIKPHLIFTVLDEYNNPVRRLIAPARNGINRITWDLRYADINPITIKDNKFNPVAKSRSGIRVMPGKYKVSFSLYYNGNITPLSDTVEFTAKKLNNTTLPAADFAAVVNFEKQAGNLVRSIRAAQKYTQDLRKRIEYIKQAIYQTPAINISYFKNAEKVSNELDDILFAFNGQKPKASEEEIPPSKVPINSRVSAMMWTHWQSTSGITQNERTAYKVLIEEFPPLLTRIKSIYSNEILPLEKVLEKANAPWTPGRMPEFNKD
jgi:hypothetical protein